MIRTARPSTTRRRALLRSAWDNTRFFVLAIAAMAIAACVLTWWTGDVPDRECTPARIAMGGDTRVHRAHSRLGSYTVLRFGNGDACWHYDSPRMR